MDAIETTTVEQDGQTYRITVYPDADAPNPLEDWGEMGTILSLNRRHRNFDPGRHRGSDRDDPDAVPLSYYEHGLCLWSVAGELPAAARCPWDSVGFAGVWLPDAADAGIRPQLRRPDPPALHAEACPPGVRRLYPMVQRRGLRLRDRADHRLPVLRRGEGRAGR